MQSFFFLFLQPMSRQKKSGLQEEIQQSELQNRIYSLVTHDMRNLFASVVGYVRLNKRSRNLSEEDSLQLLDELEFVGNRADHLFDILSFSVRFLRKNTKVSIEKTEVLNCIRDAEDIFRNELTRKQLTLEIQNEHMEATVNSDAGILSFAVRQLLHNAIKYSYCSGRINVRLLKEKKHTKLQFEDEGKGVAPEFVSSLFSGSMECVTYGTEDEKGNGLGLALSRYFLLQCGADVIYKPNTPKGSIFEISIPETK